jgi:hypothetical protein
MSEEITIQLTHDEALVLFEWLHRTDEQNNFANIIEHQAEQRALWNLTSLLERGLSELFDPNYRELLEQARTRLRDAKTP